MVAAGRRRGVRGRARRRSRFLGHDSAHRQIFNSGAWNDWTSRGSWPAGSSASATPGGATSTTGTTASPTRWARTPTSPPASSCGRRTRSQARSGLARVVRPPPGLVLLPAAHARGAEPARRRASGCCSPRATVPHRGVEAPIVDHAAGGVRRACCSGCCRPARPSRSSGCRWRSSASCSAVSFAPNHKGMPIIPAGLKVDFLRRQVLTSRNITGGVAVDFMMGGLNYQVEHHLFPSMPRPNLRHVQPVVRDVLRAEGRHLHRGRLLPVVQDRRATTSTASGWRTGRVRLPGRRAVRALTYRQDRTCSVRATAGPSWSTNDVDRSRGDRRRHVQLDGGLAPVGGERPVARRRPRRRPSRCSGRRASRRSRSGRSSVRAARRRSAGRSAPRGPPTPSWPARWCRAGGGPRRGSPAWRARRTRRPGPWRAGRPAPGPRSRTRRAGRPRRPRPPPAGVGTWAAGAPGHGNPSGARNLYRVRVTGDTPTETQATRSSPS